MEKNILDNPFFIFFILFLSILTNTISSIYFSSIMIVGFVFLAFIKCVKSNYYYSAFFMILAFLFIELNNGFAPFSLVLLAIFLYVFIIPKVKKVVSYSGVNYFIYILWFYLGVIAIWSFSNDIDITLLGTIFLNIFIDFILVGIFL